MKSFGILMRKKGLRRTVRTSDENLGRIAGGAICVLPLTSPAHLTVKSRPLVALHHIGGGHPPRREKRHLVRTVKKRRVADQLEGM